MFSRPVHSGFLPHLEVNWSATSPKQERTAATGNRNAKNQAFRTIDLEVILRDMGHDLFRMTCQWYIIWCGQLTGIHELFSMTILLRSVGSIRISCIFEHYIESIAFVFSPALHINGPKFWRSWSEGQEIKRSS